MEYCCDTLKVLIADPKIPLKYRPKFREVFFKDLTADDIYYVIEYCAWCGKRLPESFRDQYIDILEKEHGITDSFATIKKKPLPKEFESDEWWKKRKM